MKFDLFENKYVIDYVSIFHKFKKGMAWLYF